MRLGTILSLLIAFFASAILAQTLTVGNVYTPSRDWPVGPVAGTTYIDLVHPATANGFVTHIGFAFPMWLDECQGAAKVKFFRRSGDFLTMITELGPFDKKSSSPHTELYPLTPPVQVLAGDLIGVVQPNDCGHFLLEPEHEGQYLAFQTDVVNTVPVSEAKTATGTLNAWAVGDVNDEFTARIIPIVGSATGAYGSQWKTSVQLLNPHSVAATGRLVFRAARVPASATDAGLVYSLDPGATQTIPDVAAAVGQSGLGSIDVVLTVQGTESPLPPVIVAHILHERGGGGAVGVTEEAVDPNSISTGSRVLNAGATGYLIAPHSATGSRFNIGVRTLASGATITATLQTAAGATSQTVTKEFPANYLEQFTANEFFNAFLIGGESIAVTVVKGSAIVYGSAIDNVTNDPSIQHAVAFVPVKAQ